jgi:hypothetical protein
MICRVLLVAVTTCLLQACSSDVDDTTSSQGGNAGSGGAGAQGGSAAGGNGGDGAQGGSGAAGGGSGGQTFGSCGDTGQCIVAIAGCCGTCGAPTLESVTPIAADEAQAFFDATCPDPDNTPCPGCASFPNGNLYAYCEAGQCVEADVSQGSFSECTQSADCTLRWGAGCCAGCDGAWEPGFGGDLIAVSTSKLGDFAAQVCAGADVACRDCEPIFPPGAFAECVAGHCTVGQAMPGG